MKKRTILSLLFIFEMIVGVVLLGYGVLKDPFSPVLFGLGWSVFIAHAVEYAILSKVD